MKDAITRQTLAQPEIDLAGQHLEDLAQRLTARFGLADAGALLWATALTLTTSTMSRGDAAELLRRHASALEQDDTTSGTA